MATIGRMAVPFYILYARDLMELSGKQVGVITGAFIIAQSLGPLLAGVMADRRGFRFVFLASLAIWVLAVALLMNTQGQAGLIGVFALLGAGLGGFQMSAQNLVLEFGSRRNLPMRIAVANSAADLVAAVGSVAGGLLTYFVGFSTIFWIAIGFQVTAFVTVALFVDDPRHRTL
jgi:MFS family permease